MRIPTNYIPKSFSLQDLNEWYLIARPKGDIGMTIEQEMWYRNLLPPEYIVPEFVTYRGHKITIYDDTRAS